MKANRILIPAALVMIVMTVMMGCKYDVKQPLWDQPYTEPVSPTIERIDPNSATAGVNTIKIIGTNFAANMDSNKVYFDKTKAEMISASPTQIEVRRPNLISDTVNVKVVSYGTLLVAKFFPYKVSSVWEKFGGFVENKMFTAMAVDGNNNVYMIGDSPRNIYKVLPNGENILLGVVPSPQAVTDAAITPDGHLLTMANNRRIYQINSVTGDSTTYVNMSPAAKKAAYGDFDQHGNFWCGSVKSDLILVKPDRTNQTMTLYAKDEIAGVKVANGNLYLLLVFGTAPIGHSKTGIWRHQILDANGTLGAAQIVLDWPSTGTFASADSMSMAVSNDNMMYIGSTVPQVMSLNLATGEQDILYKDILPNWAAKLVWGTGNDLFMFVAGSERYLAKVAMGKTGASK